MHERSEDPMDRHGDRSFVGSGWRFQRCLHRGCAHCTLHIAHCTVCTVCTLHSVHSGRAWACLEHPVDTKAPVWLSKRGVEEELVPSIQKHALIKDTMIEARWEELYILADYCIPTCIGQVVKEAVEISSWSCLEYLQIQSICHGGVSTSILSILFVRTSFPQYPVDSEAIVWLLQRWYPAKPVWLIDLSEA